MHKNLNLPEISKYLKLFYKFNKLYARHIFLIEIKLLLCDNLVILALGITHFTWIKGQHIVVNLLLVKPFFELPTRVMTFLFS